VPGWSGSSSRVRPSISATTYAALAVAGVPNPGSTVSNGAGSPGNLQMLYTHLSSRPLVDRRSVTPVPLEKLSRQQDVRAGQPSSFLVVKWAFLIDVLRRLPSRVRLPRRLMTAAWFDHLGPAGVVDKCARGGRDQSPRPRVSRFVV